MHHIVCNCSICLEHEGFELAIECPVCGNPNVDNYGYPLFAQNAHCCSAYCANQHEADHQFHQATLYPELP